MIGIETFRIAPLPAVAAAEVAASIAFIHGDVSPRPWTAQGIQRLLMAPASLGFICGVAQGEPVGFVLAQCALDEAEILMIAVRRIVQRQGVARRLLTDLHEAFGLAGISRVFLDVAENNLPARALYQSMGYVEFGRRKGYYPSETLGGDAVDALLLALDLPEPASVPETGEAGLPLSSAIV
jgi:[ribosomal protein S18]-alanine N-acetyltransferase